MKKKQLSSWLRLIRIPNLLTVPGDPLAGFILAAGVQYEKLLLAIGAALLLYAGGLIGNDLADVARDRITVPERPLPSGAIGMVAARRVMAAFWTVALLLVMMTNISGLTVGVLLLAAVMVYDFRTKCTSVTGPLNMGMCRGLSLLLGAAVANGLHQPVTWAAAITLSAYVGAVTHLAQSERLQKAVPSRISVWLPTGSLLLGFMITVWTAAATAAIIPGLTYASTAAMALAILFAGGVAQHIRKQAGMVRPAQIGGLITLLLLIQAAFICMHGSRRAYLAALLILFFWPLNHWLKRFFQAS